MKLDDLELMEIHHYFGVGILPKDAQFDSLAQLDAYLCDQLAATPAGENPCPVARAFWRLCERLTAAGYHPVELTPSTPTAHLLPAKCRKRDWTKLAADLALRLPPPRYGPAFSNFARLVFVAALVAPMFPPFVISSGSFWIYALFLVPSMILCGTFLLAFFQLLSPLFRCSPPAQADTLAGLAYLLVVHEKPPTKTSWTRPEVWATLQWTFADLLLINPRRIRRKTTFLALATMR